MKLKVSFLCFALLCCVLFLRAQQQRALVIGIDKYKPSERSPFPELDGCKNDAQAIKILINARYKFSNNNIRDIYNEQATRANIIKAFNELLNKSEKGDVAFIFYAGHGSEVKNSLSHEERHMDQSIVPVDTYLKGIEDIRDKELARIFNQFVDKGVILTCIFDCCHSGSIGRGIRNSPPRLRYMKDADYDAKDGSNPVAPENRQGSNYLIMSAVQSNQFAEEQKDENGVTHGAFTIALLRALNQQSVYASAIDLFNATSAILRSNSISGEPVLAGDKQRFVSNLFGIRKDSLSNTFLIPVRGISNNVIQLQGGLVIGLHPENELTTVDSLTKIRITKVTGPDVSEAEVIKGDIKDVKAGEMFKVTNWASSSAPFLKIYIPATGLSFQKVKEYGEVVREAKNKADLVNDFEKGDPDLSLYFSQNSWWYNDTREGMVRIGAFNARGIVDLAAAQKISINLPPPQLLTDHLKEVFALYKNIEVTGDPNDAQYILNGTITESGTLTYGLTKTQLHAKDSLEMMPLQTKTFDLDDDKKENFDFVADSIVEYGLRLSKIRGWLAIQPPVNEKFPFHMEVRKASTGKPVTTDGVRIKEIVKLFIVRDDDFVHKWNYKQKFIYIFDIDRMGNITLLYPDPSEGNNSNKFPKLDENKIPVHEKELDVSLEVAEPVGTDNYYFIATDEAIGSYAIIFNQVGVRGAVIQGAFDQLLNLGNAATRGSHPTVTPAGWVLQRVPVKTTH
ncbi:MAG: caspase family protein [Ginsengibacter sp.]